VHPTFYGDFCLLKIIIKRTNISKIRYQHLGIKVA
jgi:hypothetical protein